MATRHTQLLQIQKYLTDTNVMHTCICNSNTKAHRRYKSISQIRIKLTHISQIQMHLKIH